MCTELLPPGGNPFAVKYIISGEDEEKDVSSYSTTSRKKRRHWKLKEEALVRTM
jgi:hypothetical protein